MKGEQDATLDIFVRSLAPTTGLERQRALVDQLDRMESDGLIDDYNIHVWGDAVSIDSALSETATGRGVRSQVAGFQQWALAENVSVQPFFERKSQSSSITGDEQTLITLPEITVAEYEGTELVGMAPHQSAGDTVTVQDYLDDVEMRRTQPLAEDDGASHQLSVPSDD